MYFLSHFQPGQDDDSDSTCEEIIMQQRSASSKRTSLISDKSATANAPPISAAAANNIKQFKNLSKECIETEVDVEGEDEEFENNSLWMTATQFSQLLDKQEALENLGYSLVNKKKKSKQQESKVIF